MLAPPTIANQGCSQNSDISVAAGNTERLAPGVHCGHVQIANGGSVELDAGEHVFRGGLNAANGSEISGDDVLMVFERAHDVYTLDGKLDVKGRTSGEFRGFVFYHEDYRGNSNSIDIGPQADFNAEGLIYLPNTNMRISADVNELVTRSILVTDRIELSGNASFTAVANEQSTTPLPDALLATDASNLRLTR